MAEFTPLNPDYESVVRGIFARQTVMVTIGAALTHVAPGYATIELPYRDDLAQQGGFIHAGIITTIVDSACGCAAGSLMPAGSDVLTVEYKVNLLAPARGEHFIARGRVLKAGRTLTVCAGDVLARDGESEKLVATMLATMIQRRISA